MVKGQYIFSTDYRTVLRYLGDNNVTEMFGVLQCAVKYDSFDSLSLSLPSSQQFSVSQIVHCFC